MDRIRLMAYVLGVWLTAGLAAPAWAQEGAVPASQLGLELRAALGFGPKGLAALGADAQTHESIVLTAADFCEQNRQTIEPLLDEVRLARQEAFRQYELNSDQVEDADEALLAAIDDLGSACADLVETLDGLLSTEQAGFRGQLATNPLLDVPLALLDLTEGQFDQLRAAQRERDLVFKHHRKRKDLAAVKEAYDTFEAAVAQILTPEQQTAYAAFTDSLLRNIGAVRAREETLCAQ
jgi:hypothetical protein